MTREEWQRLWVFARNAMPSEKSDVQWLQLSRVLAVTFNELSSSFWNYEPYDPEITRKLNLLASPFGKALAKKKLKELDEPNG